ncbi:SDR family NAD(P)-dependent oxidoreductase [Robbsia sp. KACC 23696]|uniref:SDR family NAD(P)-dependent oxidoreductase n=1 Tax=Robbsia sp. KACC 23696 TaxID=3149231 RepID=UPI00325A564B
MGYSILVTGAAYGHGLLAARELALAGHTVYACVPELNDLRATHIEKVANWAIQHGVDLRIIELNVQSDASVERGVAQIIDAGQSLDVVIHGASHMAFGPAEAFTPEQMHLLFDINVVGCQRVNRAVLPYLRKQGRGYLIWIGSLVMHMGTPPFLAPYFAAKAAMDVLAESYSTELAKWGIETTIIVPGSFTRTMNRLANAETPNDIAVGDAYLAGPYSGVPDKVLIGFIGMESDDVEPRTVAREIVRVVDLPFGTRPFRAHVGPSPGGTTARIAAAETMRQEILDAMGLGDLISPAPES